MQRDEKDKPSFDAKGFLFSFRRKQNNVGTNLEYLIEYFEENMSKCKRWKLLKMLILPMVKSTKQQNSDID